MNKPLLRRMVAEVINLDGRLTIRVKHPNGVLVGYFHTVAEVEARVANFGLSMADMEVR